MTEHYPTTGENYGWYDLHGVTGFLKGIAVILVLAGGVYFTARLAKHREEEEIRAENLRQERLRHEMAINSANSGITLRDKNKDLSDSVEEQATSHINFLSKSQHK